MSETLDCLNTLINDVVRDAQNYGISYAEAYFNRVNDLLTDNGDTRDLVFAELIVVILMPETEQELTAIILSSARRRWETSK